MPESIPARLDALGPIVEKIVSPQAGEIDRKATYPSDAVAALGEAGLLGLISSPSVGGLGGGFRDACAVVGELARHCGSTAMVVLMHYAATAVIEAHGPLEARSAIAAGQYLTTLAFSEAGSRSMFWAPTSTPSEAQKSWVTSASHAHGYVWSTRPVAAEGMSTLWLVPADRAGLEVGPPFDGLGLRGNDSRPVTASGLELTEADRLGPDGGGFDIMLGAVLPWFQVMSAAVSVGLADACVVAAAAHAGSTRFEHLDQVLAENLVVRSNVARMRVQTDQAATLLGDALSALENGRDDATLRVLESKAAGSEMALAVTGLAMRVCGGAAFRKEVGVERRFRDAQASTVMAPTTDTLYDFLGRVLCGLPLF